MITTIVLSLIIVALLTVIVAIAYASHKEIASDRQLINNMRKAQFDTDMELGLIRQERATLIGRIKTLEDKREKEIQEAIRAWASEHTQNIRDEAIKKSKAVILGQVSEHLAPFISKWPYSAKDVRFIGNPIDFVIFDGLTEGDLRKVIFMEVKTNKSQLNSGQREIRDAIIAGKVAWDEVRLDV